VRPALVDVSLCVEELIRVAGVTHHGSPLRRGGRDYEEQNKR
jgi:hypothetical protein